MLGSIWKHLEAFGYIWIMMMMPLDVRLNIDCFSVSTFSASLNRWLFRSSVPPDAKELLGYTALHLICIHQLD